MTLFDHLCDLRQRLLSALDDDDRETLTDLAMILGELREDADLQQYPPIVGLLGDMEDIARHGATGVRFKAITNLLTVDTIRDAVSSGA